jgi:methyl-accepting chemotaxis protein
MSKNIPWLKSLNAKLGGILAVIAFAVVGMIIFNIATFTSMRGDAAKMNLFGLGRLYFTTLNCQANDLFDTNSDKRAATRTQLRELMKLNDQRMETLSKGDPSKDIEPVTDPAILAGLQQNTNLWTQRIKPLLEELMVAESLGNVKASLDLLKTLLTEANNNGTDLVNKEQILLRGNVASANLVQYLFLGFLALFLGIIFLVVRSISQRARILVAATERIADGDFGQKVAVTGSDELAVLGSTFNTMADNLQTLMAAIADTVNSLASASSELLAGTTQQSSSAQEQAAAVTETVTTVDEVQQTSEQAAGRAKAVAESAQRAAEIGKAGRQAIEEAVAAMATVKQQTESIAENILALAERAQVIGEIIASVNDIAEQTNLLALNAGIEAARAGEQGAGFTVVAREIKDLAGQAKKATAQVREILGEIQKATNSAVMVTEEGSKSVNTTIKAVNQAGETIRTLATTIDEAARAAQQISASAVQQSTGIGQVKQAMRDINEATNQSLAATKQTERAAQDLNALGAKLKKQLAA